MSAFNRNTTNSGDPQNPYDQMQHAAITPTHFDDRMAAMMADPNAINAANAINNTANSANPNPANPNPNPNFANPTNTANPTNPNPANLANPTIQQNPQTTPISTPTNTGSKIPVALVIVLILVAIAGLAFGIWGVVTNVMSNQTYQNLEAKIESLETEVTNLSRTINLNFDDSKISSSSNSNN